MKKNKIKIAIIGFGNLGKGVKKAIDKNPDMELVEIITRRPEAVKKIEKDVPVYSFDDFKSIADVAILCGGSKDDIFGVENNKELSRVRIPDPYSHGQGLYFAQFFNTVDSFDTHRRIPDYYRQMGKVARINRHTSIISAGWDPGTFSMERVLADAFIPGGKIYTFWGPGVSQGHSDAVRQVPGVLDARSYTIPIKKSIKMVKGGKNPVLKPGMMHRRVVYVVAHPDADKRDIIHQIKKMPNYFADYDTKVIFVSEKELNQKHREFPHKGSIILSGNTSNNNNALIEYHCDWGSNPEATASILVACARACYRFNKEKRYGAYTMLEIPPSYYSPHPVEELLANYM
ncbi:MAG: diaminopimelate dehydrogenase [candidate division WOR-3 bacterium]|nr:diaminopimelate dehydrogenase [candidate division WOR-3 bacterium]